MTEEIMSSQALEFEVKKPPQSVALTVSPTPMDLLQTAIMQDVSIEKLAQLMELQQKWEANEARKAFVVAMNAFKSHPPVIEKNKHVKFGQTEYDHATLDHVCKVLTKSLGEHGITHRWNVTQQDGVISVTCILTHELGHSEETTLQGPADSSGSKNAIQQIGSTVTYLQRYTLLAATGLAAGGDNDGAGSGQSLDDVSERIEFINNCASFDELKRVFKTHYTAAKDAKDNRSEKLIVAAYEAKKRELNANR